MIYFIHGNNATKLQLLKSMLDSGSYIQSLYAMEFLLQQTDVIDQLEQYKITKDASSRNDFQKKIIQGTQTQHFSRAIFNRNYLLTLKMFGYTITGNASTPIIQKELWSDK